jgi:PAS domain S-box-containing protein
MRAMPQPLDQVLIRLSDAVANARKLTDICQAAVTGIREATDVSRASVLLFDPDGVMRFKAWCGLSDAYRTAVEGHTPWAPAQPVPDPIVVPDVHASGPDLAPHLAIFAREQIRAMAFVPVVSQRRVIGKFMLYRSAPGGFTASEVSAALTIGYQIGFAVERTRREAEHEAQHQRLLFALEAARMGTWEWDLGTRVTWSEHLERIHGLAPGAFTGDLAEWERAIHPADRPRVLASLRRALEDPDARHDVEYRLRTADGQVRWVQGQGRVERDTSGRPVRMTGVCMDIGTRKRTAAEVADALRLEASLRKRLTRLTEGAERLLTSLSSESVIEEVLALARTVVTADAYAVWRREGAAWRIAASHGLSADYTATRLQLDGPITFRTTVVAEDVDLLPVLEARRPAYAREGIRSLMSTPLQMRGEPGGAIVFYYRSHHMPREAEQRVAMALAQMAAAAISNAELHARQQDLYRQMQEASRLKDEFLATLSHELRTPLNVIMGRVRMLTRSDLPAEAVKTAETIDRNAALLARLVEDLLDVSRITLGQVTIDLQPLDFPALVRAVVAGVDPTARARGVILEVEAGDDLPPLVGDAVRLQQIVWNLLSNAIKFTPAGGRVTVTMTRQDQRLVLSVCDTGEGIAPAFLPCIFDMFRQAEPTASRRFGGLGLGLSIVRRLVELHGGTVTASSDGPGHGARFDIYLPVSTLGGVRDPARRVTQT